MSDVLLIPLPLILLGWAIGGGSPGPATLAISGTSMAQGRQAGLALASGVICGSATWGIAAALGFAALMQANVWVFQAVRYAGALYLLFLAVKSLRAAWVNVPATPMAATRSGPFIKGLLLHLTNPKAVLGWGSIFAIALAPNAQAGAVWGLFLSLIVVSASVFWGYALLFSTGSAIRVYTRAKRWFELAFGVLFGLASLKILTLRTS